VVTSGYSGCADLRPAAGGVSGGVLSGTGPGAGGAPGSAGESAGAGRARRSRYLRCARRAIRGERHGQVATGATNQ
jgi:hypothetical protein